jgi:hypothetical protein
MIESNLALLSPSGKPGCINLRDRFGRDYRVTHDESFAAERPEFRAAEEVWLQVIPGQSGHVAPWDGTHLVACTRARGPVAQAIRSLPGVVVVQDGNDGINATFPVELFDRVAAILRLRRRRRLSPEARAAAAVRLAKYQFRPAVGSPGESAVCVGEASLDSQAMVATDCV